MIVTLGSASIVTGITFLYTDQSNFGKPAEIMNDIGFGWIGPIPILFFLYAFIAAIALIIQNRTVFGLDLYAVGGSEQAASSSGVRVDRVKLIAYVACGFLAAVAGIAMSTRMGAGEPLSGVGFDWDRRGRGARGYCAHRWPGWGRGHHRRCRNHRDPQQCDEPVGCLLVHPDRLQGRDRFDRRCARCRHDAPPGWRSSGLHKREFGDTPRRRPDGHVQGRSSTPSGPALQRTPGKWAVYGPWAILIALVVIDLISSDFLSTTNLVNILRQAAPLMIVALGQTLVILVGGIDVSVGAVIATTTVIGGSLMRDSNAMIIPTVLVVIGVGLVIGLVHYLLIVRVGTDALVTTLGTLLILGVST